MSFNTTHCFICSLQADTVNVISSINFARKPKKREKVRGFTHYSVVGSKNYDYKNMKFLYILQKKQQSVFFHEKKIIFITIVRYVGQKM